MEVANLVFKTYKTLRPLLDTGREAGRSLNGIRIGFIIFAITLSTLAMLILTTSCAILGDDIRDEDKEAIQDIVFSNSIVEELTVNKETYWRFFGVLEEKNGLLIAGIVEIVFDEPFFVDMEWPSVETTVNDFDEPRDGPEVRGAPLGRTKYVIEDYVNHKKFTYDFSKTVHSSKVVRRLLVYVYFIDEDFVVIEPLAEGEGEEDGQAFYKKTS